MLAKEQPPEQHAERRHQEVVGARCRGAAHRQQVEPEHVAEHRHQQHQVGERGKQAPGRGDLADRLEGEGEGQQRQATRHVLDAIADPEPAVRRQPLEQDGPADERHQGRKRERNADRAVGAAGNTALHDKRDPGDPEQQPDRLAPVHPLAQEGGREHGREDRIGADDERRQAGRDAAHADVVEAQIERIVGHT